MIRSTWRWGLGAVLLTGIFGCSSDDFSAVGGRLPLDVGQEADSLLVSLDPPLLAIAAESVPVQLDQDFLDRPLLYLGNRDEGSWKATPLFDLDFDDARLVGEGTEGFQDSVTALAVTAGVVTSVEFEFRQTQADAKKGILRVMDLRALAAVDSLSRDLLDQDISTLLGPIVGGVTETQAGPTLAIPMDVATALNHLDARDRFSVAVVDKTPSSPVFGGDADPVPNSNFVAGASVETSSIELYRETASLPTELTVEAIVPKLRIGLDADFVRNALQIPPETTVSSVSIEVPVVEDMTHLQHDLASANDLSLGAHLVSRLWMDFDVANSPIPGDATINEAVLVLIPRPASELGGYRQQTVLDSLGTRQSIEAADIRTATFEVTRVDAEAASTQGLSVVLNSASSVSLFDGADTLRVDVTDFVQRDANLLLDDPVGIMIAMNETQVLNSVEYYGIDAPDSLQPRIEIRFTPPADFWE